MTDYGYTDVGPHTIVDANVYEADEFAILQIEPRSSHNYYNATCILPNHVNNTDITLYTTTTNQENHINYRSWAYLASGEKCYDHLLDEIVISQSKCRHIPGELRKSLNQTSQVYYDRDRFFSFVHLHDRKKDFINGIYSMGNESSRDVLRTFLEHFQPIQTAFDRKRDRDFKEKDFSYY